MQRERARSSAGTAGFSAGTAGLSDRDDHDRRERGGDEGGGQGGRGRPRARGPPRSRARALAARLPRMRHDPQHQGGRAMSACAWGIDHEESYPCPGCRIRALESEKAVLEARVRHLQQFASTEGEHAAWHFLLTERIDYLKARAHKAETDVKGLLLSNDSLVDALEKAEARVKAVSFAGHVARCPDAPESVKAAYRVPLYPPA